MKVNPNKNCHEYCMYGSTCKFSEGAAGKDPDECPAFYKIDDLMMEARDLANEDRYFAEREEKEEEWMP